MWKLLRLAQQGWNLSHLHAELLVMMCVVSI
jgi:hypothetical protein